MIHIACCFDRRFEILFLILAQSIAGHTRAPVTIHALHDGPVPLAMARAPKTDGLRIEFQDIGARYEKIEVNGPQSVVTYARFVLPDILAGVDRVLYLDVDMLTRRDLTPLYETDLEGRALGAVVDHTLVDASMTPDPITITPDAPLPRAIELLLEHKISGLPVVEGDRLVGIVTVTDLLRALARLLEQGGE